MASLTPPQLDTRCRRSDLPLNALRACDLRNSQVVCGLQVQPRARIAIEGARKSHGGIGADAEPLANDVVDARSRHVQGFCQRIARVWTFSPKGIRPPAQGCCTRLPWERRRPVSPTPTGLWPSLPAFTDPPDQIVSNRYRLLSSARRSRRARPQPRWGCEDHRCYSPKVAEYSNLGLWAATTTWLTTDCPSCAAGL